MLILTTSERLKILFSIFQIFCKEQSLVELGKKLKIFIHSKQEHFARRCEQHEKVKEKQLPNPPPSMPWTAVSRPRPPPAPAPAGAWSSRQGTVGGARQCGPDRKPQGLERTGSGGLTGGGAVKPTSAGRAFQAQEQQGWSLEAPRAGQGGLPG